MSTIDDLLERIFDGKHTAFYDEFEEWVRNSRRFQSFATGYQAKIKAKLKNARGESGLQDVRAELLAAAILLREERFTVEYERYAASKQRGPDLTVTFKTHTPFNVEVRRIRAVEGADEEAEARANKLVSVMCDKANQMPPGIINMLWLVGEWEISEADLNRAAAALRQAVERKDDSFFARRGFDGAGDFLKRYRQLSGIVVHQPGQCAVWLNAFARHKAPPELINAIQRLATT